MSVVLLNLADVTKAGQAASFFDKLHAVSLNTGNLCFFEGLRQTAFCDRELSAWDGLLHVNDTVILCLANFIRPGANLEYELSVLQKCPSKHIILVGVGAQADTYRETFQFTPSLRRFLSHILDKSATIGVRGVYSAELLARNGFRSTHVIGCPSAFMNGRTPATFSTAPIRSVGISATPGVRNRNVTRALYELGIRVDAPYFMQGELHYVAFHDKNISRQDLFEDLERHLLLDTPANLDESSLSSWISRKSSFHFELREWQNALRSVDLLVGTRIHGALLALNSGVRTALLTCDARTCELASFFNIPCITVDMLPEVFQGGFLDHLYPRNYLLCYEDRLVNYLAFLESNRIPSRLSVDKASQYCDPLVSGEGRVSLREMSGIGIGSIELSTVARENKRIHADSEIPGFDQLKAEDSIESARKTMNALGISRVRGGLPSKTPAVLSPEFEAIEVVRARIEDHLLAASGLMDRYVELCGNNPYFVLGEEPIEIRKDKISDAQLFSSRLRMLAALPGSHALEVCPLDVELVSGLLESRADLCLTVVGEDPLSGDLFGEWEGRFLYLNGPWERVFSTLPPRSFDRIVYTAPLTKASTLNFLESCLPLLKPRGHIVVGNYAVWSVFEGRAYGVVQAVNEFLNRQSFRVSGLVLQRYGYHTISLQMNGTPDC